MPITNRKDPKCSECSVPARERICLSEKGQADKECPTIHMSEVIESALEKYDDKEVARFAKAASIQEAECYLDRHKRPLKVIPVKTRVEEIIGFAKLMGYKRLGVAFCGGVLSEGAILTDILKKRGFEVVSVMCKVGRVSKRRIGIKQEEQILTDAPFEVMCNPIAQAEILNQAGTDFNIMMGLCVGHDALFLKHVNAYTTVFAVKERVLGHNPMAALYLASSYYTRLHDKE